MAECSSTKVEVLEDNECFFTINVQIKIKLQNSDEDLIKSEGKTFMIGGVKYPITRFGTMALASLSDQSVITDLLTKGGLAVAIVWGLLQSHREMAVWVRDSSDYHFVLEVKKSEHKRILDQISRGILASRLETTLQGLKTPNYYKNIKIKLIKIIRESVVAKGRQSPNGESETTTDKFDNSGFKRLESFEEAANHMESKQYDWAMKILKQLLTNESSSALRLDLLMQSYTCASHQNHKEELDELFPQIMNLVDNVTIPPSDLLPYVEKHQKLSELLIAKKCFLRAVELALAFHRLIRQITDHDDRLEFTSMNIQRTCKAIISIFKINPSVCLQLEIRNYIKKLGDEVDCMKKDDKFDALPQAQAVYYTSFALAEVENTSKNKLGDFFKGSSIEFKNLINCWQDTPLVMNRLKQHPEISQYLKDAKYRQIIEKICGDPRVLKNYVGNVRIMQAHNVLASKFGLSDQNGLNASEFKRTENDEETEARQDSSKQTQSKKGHSGGKGKRRNRRNQR